MGFVLGACEAEIHRGLSRRSETQKNYFEKDELIEIFRTWGKIEELSFGTYYWSAILKVH